MIAGYRWWDSRSWKRPTPIADGFTTAMRVSFLSAVNCAARVDGLHPETVALDRVTRR